jgi:hypothetical protein
MTEMRKAYTILAGKPEGKRPLADPLWTGLMWQYRNLWRAAMNAVMNLRVYHKKAGVS